MPTPAFTDAFVGTLTAASVGGAASKPAASSCQSLMVSAALMRNRLHAAAALPWPSTATAGVKRETVGSAGAFAPSAMSVTAPNWPASPGPRRVAWIAGRPPLTPLQIATAAPSGATSTRAEKPLAVAFESGR